MRILSFAILSLTFLLSPLPSGQRRPTPENPCELIARADLATLTGFEVISAERTHTILESIRAQEEKRKVGPDTLCVYKTNSAFGEIMIDLPSEQDPAHYRQHRDTYFAKYPDLAKPIPNLGQDSWIGGGLSVLIRDDLWISINVQNNLNANETEQLLIRIARRLSTIWL